MGDDHVGHVVYDRRDGPHDPTREQEDTIDRLAARYDRVEVYPIWESPDVDADCLSARPGSKGLRLVCRLTIAPNGRTRPRGQS